MNRTETLTQPIASVNVKHGRDTTWPAGNYDERSIDFVTIFNSARGSIDTLPLVRKSVLAWAAKPTGLVPVYPDTTDLDTLRSPSLLPAQPRTFVVFVEAKDGSLVELGVQTEGASHPKWDELAMIALERLNTM